MFTCWKVSQKGHKTGHHPSANKPCLRRQTKAPHEPAYSQHCQQATDQWLHLWRQTLGFPIKGAQMSVEITDLTVKLIQNWSLL